MQGPDFKDKVVMVTGASRGIGQGIASAFAKAQAKVIGTATTSEGAEKITQYLSSLSDGHQGLVLDVKSQQSIDEAYAYIKQHVGSVQILINNAAITQDNLFLRMKDSEWEDVIKTDLTSVFKLARACIRDMIKARQGRIINIGSVVGSTGNPGQANYCAAKAGIMGLTKALALEVGSRNITVNTVAPGYIATDMTNALTEDQQSKIFEKIPMNRIGDIEDVAEAVLFLASDKAKYITGQTLHVNGGMFMV